MNKFTIRIDLNFFDYNSGYEAEVKIIFDYLLSLPEITKYCIAYEVAKKTGKPHLQGIVESKWDLKTYHNKMYYIRKLYTASKSSFATVKKNESYQKYITKDGKIVLSNYTKEEMEKWGEWEDKPRDSNFGRLQREIPLCEYSKGPRGLAAAIIQWYEDQDKVEPNDFAIKCQVKSLLRHWYNKDRPEKWELFKTARATEIIGGEFIYDF